MSDIENLDELTIEELIEAEEAFEDEGGASLEVVEPEYAEADSDESPTNEPGLEGGELVAGQAVSLEEVLDTIFNILYTHSAQIQAIGEHIFGAQTEPEVPEPSKLTVVTDLA